LPLTKPIDAVVGSLPNGEGGRSGFSQACSGTSPTPEVCAFIAASSAAAPVASPVCSCCSARSPDSTGHRCPEPVLFLPVAGSTPGHGLPLGEQSVGSGS
jgi:hypothetical protein